MQCAFFEKTLKGQVADELKVDIFIKSFGKAVVHCCHGCFLVSLMTRSASISAGSVFQASSGRAQYKVQAQSFSASRRSVKRPLSIVVVGLASMVISLSIPTRA
jgi:hypothetical protein